MLDRTEVAESAAHDQVTCLVTCCPLGPVCMSHAAPARLPWASRAGVQINGCSCLPPLVCPMDGFFHRLKSSLFPKASVLGICTTVLNYICTLVILPCMRHTVGVCEPTERPVGQSLLKGHPCVLDGPPEMTGSRHSLARDCSDPSLPGRQVDARRGQPCAGMRLPHCVTCPCSGEPVTSRSL